MQERARHRHYSEQKGHVLRGIARRFGQQVGWPPKVFSAEIVYLPQIVQDRRRMMKRVTRDGKA